MPESTIVRVKRDGQIAILDNGGSNTYTVAYEPGDFQYSAPLQAVNHFLDRGALGSTPSLRYGDDQPRTLGFSAYFRDPGDTAGSPTYATLPDICEVHASDYVASNWVSTLGANGEVFVLTVNLTIDGSSHGESDKTLGFPFTSLRGSFQEGDPNNYSVSGTSYALRPTLS